jgi:DNA-directed RNA polymerase subunit RPC12/RpoP
MTSQQKATYLAAKGNRCPFCNSKTISADYAGSSDGVSSDKIYQEVECNDCCKKWTDTYTLTDVEESI